MSNEISTKLYKLNFKELINNATNKAYWTKKWEIYNYEGMRVEFSLDSIRISENKLIGAIKLSGGNTYYRDPETTMVISLQEEHFLEKALNNELVGKVDSLFLTQGEHDLYKTEKYQDLLRIDNDFEYRLKEIAEEFLDNNGVRNDDIREAYIDSYVGNNSSNHAGDYISENRDSMYIPHRITFAYIMDYKDKAERIAELAEDVDLESIFEEAEELRFKLEEDNMEEFYDNLEDI